MKSSTESFSIIGNYTRHPLPFRSRSSQSHIIHSTLPSSRMYIYLQSDNNQ